MSYLFRHSPSHSMHRRKFNLTLGCGAFAPLTFFYTAAQAQSIDSLTSLQASQGLKAALERGALSAIALLGKPNGFLANDKVRIPLPGYLNDGAKLLRTLGQGARLDDLVNAMNHAAEEAVPLAQDMLVDAVKSITIDDAKGILMGGDTSVTQFFTDKTRAPLAQKFLPVVSKMTDRVNLAEKYNALAKKAAGMGLVKGDEANIETYVTQKALDGMYFMIGEEEKKIRQNPAATGSALLKSVFGALK